MLYDFLKKNFGPGKPIFTSDADPLGFSSTIVREVKVGNIPFMIRRAKIPINRENAEVLQLLDLLKDFEHYTDYECEDETPDKIRSYIKRSQIKRSDVEKYTRWYRGVPLIQIHDRFKERNLFWFTFFHELAHIILHGKKDIFIKNMYHGNKNPQKEEEANCFAQKCMAAAGLEI